MAALMRQVFSLLVFALAAIYATSSSAQSPQPVFALAKNMCAGNFAQIIASGNGQNPANCPLASNIAANTDAYYIITITNPIGEPQQQINLIDALPPGFAKSGAIVCRDDATPTPNTVALTAGSGISSIGSISLAPGATVHCFIQGAFANPTSSTGSTRVNTVNASNGGSSPFYMTATVSTNVLTTTPLLADLSVNKTSSGSVNVASGSSLITYTIVIKNNGQVDADVADYFKLNDNLSLPPSGVPLNVEYVSSSCISTPNTNCLSGSGPDLFSSPPLFVGPAGPTNFFSWGFDSGKGMIKNQGVITLTVVIRVSQVPGISCTQTLNGNGLINQAFFTLANSTGAFSERISANNTSSVLTGVSTGQTNVDPDCGKASISIRKTQISPPPGTIVPWGTPVTYAITIENRSIPQQAISVKAGDLQDLITQGMNTPPFARQHIKTDCVNSTDPAVCLAFNPGIAADPAHKYKFYGETKRAWVTSKGFTLAQGGSVTFHTQFTYTDPECDTVPNANPKPIINTAKLKYLASVYGAASNVPQNTVFNAEASAVTTMAPRPVCEFLVTKRFTSNTPRIQFGVPFSYEVTYTNSGAQRTIGTLLDAVRLTIPNYASKLPYTATWSCKPTAGITGVTLNGSISGNASYTTNPMQGAPAANLGSNVFFPTKSSLVCTVQITLQRPAPNDPYCTQDKAEFENLALMDVTNPFNSNIAWPPSSTYNPASASNPTPQNVNWAAVKAQLPACWDASVNKSAKVDGLPSTNAPWTYVGGPAINYTITTTNKGQSNLGNPTAPPTLPQWLVEDNFNAPYANSNAAAGSPICGPVSSPWCHSAAPMDPKSKIAIKTLAPNASGVWNITYAAPFTAGQPIKNCAQLTPDLGADAANFYQNSIPSASPTACVTIPVVDVTEIKVTKSLVDNTGGNAKVGGPFNMQVSGSPYPVPTTQANFSLTTDITGMSPVHTIFPIARASTVTLSEITAPIPAASAQACGGAGNVDVIKEYQDALGTWKPMPAVLTNLNSQSVGNNITVRNTLRCKPAAISITKIVSGPAQVANINQNYTITATCSPAVTPTSVVLNAGTQSASGTIAAIAGASCNIFEPLPALPQGIKDHCTGFSQTAAWDPVIYSPANPVILGSGTTTVTVTNKWKCVASTPTQLQVEKFLDGTGGVQLSGLPFTVQAQCNPSASSPTAVTGLGGIPPAGNVIGTFQIPSGSTCQFSEPAMPTFPQPAINHCAPGIPIWNTPIFATSTTSLKVYNSWTCSSNPSTTTQLVITKKVEGPSMPVTVAQPPIAPAQNYQVTANCSKVGAPNLTSVALNAGGNTPASSTISVSVGDTCNITEAPPSGLLALSNYCNQLYYGNNGNPYTAVWESPVFTPSASIPIVAGTNNVTITNKWKCVAPTPTVATLTINKVVSKPLLPILVPNADTQTYQINATCVSGSVGVGANGSTSGSATVNVTAGANCTFTEPTPIMPPNIVAFCTGRGTPTWKPPVFTPTNLTVANGSNTVTVTNSWECISPTPTSVTLQIKKVVTGPPQTVALVPTAMQAFQISTNCSSPVSIIASSTSNGSTTVSNLTLGANCSFTETPPTVTAALSTYCTSFGGVNNVAAWDAPVITPSSLTLAAGVNNATVTNNWKCVPGTPTTGTVKFYKVVKGPTAPAGAPSLGSLNYSFSAVGATPASVSIAANGFSAGYSLPLTAPINALLNVTETLPSIAGNTLAQNFCGSGKTPTWNQPTFTKVISSPPTVEQPVTMPITVTAGETRIIAYNTWKCQ